MKSPRNNEFTWRGLSGKSYIDIFDSEIFVIVHNNRVLRVK